MLLVIFLPLLIAIIIIAAVKIKKKPLKIIGIVVPAIFSAGILIYAIQDLLFMIDLYSTDDTDSSPQFVAQVEGMTDNEDGTFTYDDGEVSLTFEEISPDEMENDIAEAAAVVQSSSDEVKNDTAKAPSVLKGEGSGNEWTAVSDDKGEPKTVYVNSGNTTVHVTVNNYPKDSGKEYAASIAAALVTDKKPYSEKKEENKYRTDSSSFYIEEANCLLYYPAQLTSFSKKGDSYIFSDKKSSASLKVTLSPNNYTSMAEVEGFIKNTENNLVLAYGPNWLTSEIRKSEKVFYGYSGFGSKYIVEAELIYPENACKIYDDLREHIKCCFVGDGIWKSKAASEGYSKDRSTVYSDKFSREIAAYYSKEYSVILLYPELFSQVEKEDGMVIFKDPVTGAQITFLADSDCLSLADWPTAYGFDESYIDGERRVKASYLDGGSYAVMYLTDNANVCAILNYPKKYGWVYEEFEQEFTIVTSSSEIRNVEMQTVFIEEYGALITMPLQFTETSFYDGVIRYEDALNGMEMAVSFDYLTSETERKNLFACFNVVADDDNIFVGDSYVRWLSNQGFFYGARGKDMKVLMQIDSPNVERAYESTLSMFSVEFVTEESKEETKAQALAKEVVKIETEAETEIETETETETETKTEIKTENMSDPPETLQPNKVLIYNSDADYKYAITDGDTWYRIKNEGNGTGKGVYDEHKVIVSTIVKILKYNNYDIDHYGSIFTQTTMEYYDEEYMLDKLVYDVDFFMELSYNSEPRRSSDLGEEIPSVLELLCLSLGIEKPDYVRDKGDTIVQTTVPADDDEESERTYELPAYDGWKYDVSELEGVWHFDPTIKPDIDYSELGVFDNYDDYEDIDYEIIMSDFYIEIDGNGNWCFFQRKPGDVNTAELDRGTFSETTNTNLSFYADSTIFDDTSYTVLYYDTEGVIYWDGVGFKRDKTIQTNNKPSNKNDENSYWNPELDQKRISFFEGTWYNASAKTFIEIDGDGNWSSYERKSVKSNAAETDHGTFVYSKNEEKTYYAKSAVNGSVRFKMVDFEPEVFLWDGVAFYQNEPANMGNEYYGWNAELYQRYISELEGTWYYDLYEGGDVLDPHTYIVIDGDGNWRYFKRESDDSVSEEVDHGILTYADYGSSYCAISTKSPGMQYFVHETSDDILAWGDEGAFWLD